MFLAPTKEKAAKALKGTAEPKPKKMSALDAVATVLGEQGKPMRSSFEKSSFRDRR